MSIILRLGIPIALICGVAALAYHVYITCHERELVRLLHSRDRYDDYFLYESDVVEAADRCDSERSRLVMERSCVKALSSKTRAYLAAWTVLYTRNIVRSETLASLRAFAAADPKQAESLASLIDRFGPRMPHTHSNELPNPRPNPNALLDALMKGAIDKEEFLRRSGSLLGPKETEVPVPKQNPPESGVGRTESPVNSDVESLAALVSLADSVRFKVCADSVSDYFSISPDRAADAIKTLHLTSRLDEHGYASLSAERVIVEFENGEKSRSFTSLATLSALYRSTTTRIELRSQEFGPLRWRGIQLCASSCSPRMPQIELC